MGYVTAELTLSNPVAANLAPLQVEALVDTGPLMLCIPERVQVQLGLVEQERREVTLADGRAASVSYVGPVHIRFENRQCFVGALVLGDEVLLGAVPIEDMDLVVVPAERKLKVNPQSPNLAHSRVK